MTGSITTATIAKAAAARLVQAAAFAAAALVAFGQMQASTLAADCDSGDLSPAIAKKRPSASVPADLPRDNAADCRLLDAITIYQGTGPATSVAVPLAEVMNRLPRADGSPAAEPFPSGGRP